MITNIITKMLGCTVVREAVESLVATMTTNTIVMMAAETVAKECGIACQTYHTSLGMRFVVGSEKSVEVSIKLADTAKKAIVSKALETIESDGFNKEKLQKALLQTVLEQIKQ